MGCKACRRDTVNSMEAAFKKIFVWLAICALPMQGIAAAVMLPCGQAHQKTISTASYEHAVARHQHSHQTAMADDARLVTAGHCHDQHGHGSHAGSGKCNSCSACSLPLAMTAPMPLSLAQRFDHASAIPFLAVTIPGFVPDALERPPRTPIV